MATQDRYILVFSSDIAFVNGQSLMTKIALDSFHAYRIFLCFYSPGVIGVFSVILSWLKIYALSIWLFVLGKHSCLYLVASRSNLGFLRDAPLYCLTFCGIPAVCHFHGADVLAMLKRPYIGKCMLVMLSRCTLITPACNIEVELRRLGVKSVVTVENCLV